MAKVIYGWVLRFAYCVLRIAIRDEQSTNSAYRTSHIAS